LKELVLTKQLRLVRNIMHGSKESFFSLPEMNYERLLVLAAASLVVSHAPFLSTTSQRINIRPWLGFRLTDYGAIISDVSLERMGYGVYLSPPCYTITENKLWTPY